MASLPSLSSSYGTNIDSDGKSAIDNNNRSSGRSTNSNFICRKGTKDDITSSINICDSIDSGSDNSSDDNSDSNKSNKQTKHQNTAPSELNSHTMRYISPSIINNDSRSLHSIRSIHIDNNTKNDPKTVAVVTPNSSNEDISVSTTMHNFTYMNSDVKDRNSHRSSHALESDDSNVDFGTYVFPAGEDLNSNINTKVSATVSPNGRQDKNCTKDDGLEKRKNHEFKGKLSTENREDDGKYYSYTATDGMNSKSRFISNISQVEENLNNLVDDKTLGRPIHFHDVSVSTDDHLKSKKSSLITGTSSPRAPPSPPHDDGHESDFIEISDDDKNEVNNVNDSHDSITPHHQRRESLGILSSLPFQEMCRISCCVDPVALTLLNDSTSSSNSSGSSTTAFDHHHHHQEYSNTRRDDDMNDHDNHNQLQHFESKSLENWSVPSRPDSGVRCISDRLLDVRSEDEVASLHRPIALSPVRKTQVG